MEQYLGGKEIAIHTDHKPLVGFHKKRNCNSKRIDSWLLKYQDMLPQIRDVIYRKGRNNGDADGMSRPEVNENHQLSHVVTRSMKRTLVGQPPINNPLSPPSDHQVVNLPRIEFDFSLDRIRKEQRSDPRLNNLLQQLLEQGKNEEYTMIDEVLYKKVHRLNQPECTKVIYIPESMRQEVLRMYHDHPTGAHFGIERTWLKLRDVCYWPGMKTTIRRYIESCDKCARFNIRRTKAPGHLLPIQYPRGPLELVSMDFWGPTPSYSPNGNRYVLVMTDHFTRYVVAHALPDNTASTTAKCFVEQLAFKFGIPRRLITDRGVHFNNELMTHLMTLLGTHHMKTAVYHPQANGVVERFNATFHPQLAKLYDANINNWDEYLFSVIYAYNTGKQSSTGYSPFELMFGRRPNLPLDHRPATISFARPNEYWRQLMKVMETYRRTATFQMQINQKQSTLRFNDNRKDPRYTIGDSVLWKIPGHRRKLEERFSGPYSIIETRHPTYTIQDLDSSSPKQVHVSDLKPAYQRTI